MIPQQNKPIGIFEWKRAQQDPFDEREDRGGGANTQGEGEDDAEGKARCFAQLAKCEADILCEEVHLSSLILEFPELLA
jgi:hypothetical protein